MKVKILGLLAAALLAGPTMASTVFMNVVDTPAEFSGTFSLTGCDSDQVFSLAGLLPFVVVEGGSLNDGLSVSRVCDNEGALEELTFATDMEGKSDEPSDNPNPKFVGTGADDWSGSGSYTNPAYADPTDNTIQRVYWSFTELNDNGRTFSGAFCFSTTSPDGCTSTPAPEPGTLALLGLGLAGLAASRRRKR